MMGRLAPILLVLHAAVAIAAVSEGSLDAGQDTPADLAALQAEVRQTATEIDGMDRDAADASADAEATGDLGDATPSALAHKRRATPTEQLEAEDDASYKSIQQLEADTASVQAQNAQNNIEQESAYESEDAAPEADAKRAYDLANNLKSTDLLPPGWVEKTDMKTGRNYYENVAAKKTTWDPPRSLVSIALAAARGQRDAHEEITQLKMKLESMASTRDLGESASTSSGACQKHVNHLQEKFQHAFVVHSKQMYDKLAKELNLTGEQIKLLRQKQAEAKIPIIMESLNDSTKLKPEVVVAQPPGKTQVFMKQRSVRELGESGGIEEGQQMREGVAADEAAKDRVAMADAADISRKVAQASAMKEAQRLHDQDVQLANEVKEAAKRKDDELAQEDAELEKSAQATDKMAAEIMGPKATAAERREEKVLLGEDSSDIDDDNTELEFNEDMSEEHSDLS